MSECQVDIDLWIKMEGAIDSMLLGDGIRPDCLESKGRNWWMIDMRGCTHSNRSIEEKIRSAVTQMQVSRKFVLSADAAILRVARYHDLEDDQVTQTLRLSPATVSMLADLNLALEYTVYPCR